MADYTQPEAVEKRTRFFDGQFLIDQDFIDEQKYHLDRERRLGKVLRVTGVADGLTVAASGANQVNVTAGTAFDSLGRQLVLARELNLRLPAATFNDKQRINLYIIYEETAVDVATTGSKSERRWLESPKIAAVAPDGAVAVAPDGASTTWDGPTVLLAQLRLDANGAVTVDSGVAQSAGLRLPGNLGIGTTSPENAEGWNKVVDVLGSGHAKLSVRTSNIDARVLAHDSGFWNSPAGMIIGTKTNHPLSFGTNAATRMTISSSGDVGIGTLSPRTALDTGTGTLSGAANDYQKAQFTLSGGGTVTWGGKGNRLKWTQRFIAISMERGTSFSNGHVNISPPTADIPATNVYNSQARSVNADGVLLQEWEALYAVHTVGGGQDAVSFRICHWQTPLNAPSNWILVAVVNGDDNTVKLGTGVILSAKSSSSRGSSVPTGTILMWSGAINMIPDGWALCNGQNDTPNLADRFVVGAGASYPVKDRGGAGSHAHDVDIGTVVTDYVTGGSVINGTNGVWVSLASPHTHNVAIAKKSSNAVSNLPLYFALAYIMKL